MHRADRVAVGILIYFIILAATFSSFTPFLEPPDEGSHFLYVHTLLETGELPIMEDRETVFASGFTERHHPPLYYFLESLLLRWTSRDDVDSYRTGNPFAAAGILQPDNVNGYLHPWQPPPGDTGLAISLGRIISIALSAGTVWLVYDMARLVFGRGPVALLAMLLAASIPSFLYISGSMNNDNLVSFVYSLGLVWLLRTWKHGYVTRSSMALLGLLLGALALSKLNGVNLFALVYVGLVIGAVRGRFQWRNVLLTIGASLAIATILAGWWYLRSYLLYGDFLAVEATGRIWGRGPLPTEIDAILGEAWGVWLSFWLVLGKFNIRAPDGFYLYVTALTIVGCLGMIRVWRRYPLRRPYITFWLTAFILVVVSLLVTTRRINASQGRILFPVIGPVVIFIAAGLFLGWRRRYSFLLVLPLVVVALLTPVAILARAYGQLLSVAALPQDAERLDAYVGDMHWMAYRLHQDTVAPGDTFSMDVYFTGTYPDDLVLQAKTLDPHESVELGGTHIFPGMTFTSQLENNGVIYRVPVTFLIDSSTEPLAPRQLRIFLDLLDGDAAREDDLRIEKIPWQDAEGNDLPGSLNVDGPTLIDPAYEAPTLLHEAGVVFGDSIELVSYDVGDSSVAAGEAFNVTLLWRARQSIPRDWTLAIGLLNAAGETLAQADAMPAGYPTSSWRVGVDFVDERTLVIPEDAPAGEYRLFVGWYDGDERLPFVSENDLYILPQTIAIKP